MYPSPDRAPVTLGRKNEFHPQQWVSVVAPDAVTDGVVPPRDHVAGGRLVATAASAASWFSRRRLNETTSSFNHPPTRKHCSFTDETESYPSMSAAPPTIRSPRQPAGGAPVLGRRINARTRFSHLLNSSPSSSAGRSSA